MSDTFRPSWIRDDGTAALEKPTTLVALLTVLGLLAGGVGLLAGASIHDTVRPLHAALVCIAWSVPYLFSATYVWQGADTFWYGILQVLGFWGAMITGWMLVVLPRLGFPFAAEGGRSTDGDGVFFLVFVPLFFANVAMLVLARSEERRFYGEVPRTYRQWKWMSFGVVMYYLLTMLL